MVWVVVFCVLAKLGCVTNILYYTELLAQLSRHIFDLPTHP
jgi:hypothetical protein